MLTEAKEPPVKVFIPPVYPTRPTPPFHVLKKRYLRTRDFYDLPESVEHDSILYADSFELERKRFFKRDMRLVIYPSDVAAIYGLSARTGRRVLQTIREAKGLPKGAPVTIRDFCAESHLDYQTIHDFIMES